MLPTILAFLLIGGDNSFGLEVVQHRVKGRLPQFEDAFELLRERFDQLVTLHFAINQEMHDRRRSGPPQHFPSSFIVFSSRSLLVFHSIGCVVPCQGI